MKRICLIFCSLVLLISCQQEQAQQATPDSTGSAMSIVVFSDELNTLLDPDAKPEVLASGFEWSEGPVWVNDDNRGYILFSDVPENVIYRWSETEGLTVFLSPAGFEEDNNSIFREPGTNGLILSRDGHLIAANHGQRQLSLIDIESKEKTPLVSSFDGQSFNSPNDLVMNDHGDIYFTDPPYGLEGINDSPHKELPFNGVFRYGSDGSLEVIDQNLSYPNGVGLMPDGKTLIVANSDPLNPIWQRYNLDENGSLISSAVFYDATSQVEGGAPGLPDGLAIDENGYVFASGPGGIFIFSPEGELLGIIDPGRAAANCTFGGLDGSVLFITADDVLLSVQTKTRGQYNRLMQL